MEEQLKDRALHKVTRNHRLNNTHHNNSMISIRRKMDMDMMTTMAAMRRNMTGNIKI